MFSTNAERGVFSLRTRAVLSTFCTSGLIGLIVAATVSVVACVRLLGEAESLNAHLADDLVGEYAEFGGLTDDFRHCMAEDAEEHDAKRTFIFLLDATNGVRFATATPVGYRRRLLGQMEKGRFNGRLYTEKNDVEHQDHGAVRYVSRPLPDGARILVARDVTDVERFLIFLVSTLGGGAVLSVLLSCLSSFLIASRVLKLNEVVAAKDAAYAELRHVTDDIAHDLRTPLTRLSMAAETALSGGTLREPFPVQVHTETTAMLALINTMLEIAQTDAKIDRTPRETLDLASFVRGVCDLYAPAYEDAKVTLATDLPATEIVFSGHRGKLQQLVGNLLDNALKYTPAGGKVTVTLARANGGVRLTVADTGCGIAAADLPFIFRRFWRADSARHMPGNGLGLALVQAIATSYGGRVTCTSRVGEGTTFVVEMV